MNSQPLTAIFLVIAPVILITGLIKGFGKRFNFYEHILASAGSVLLSILVYLKLYSKVYGQTAFDPFWKSFRQLFTSGVINADYILSMNHQLGMFRNFDTAEQLAGFFIEQMKMAIPAVLLIFSLAYGVFLFLILRLIMKKFGYSTQPVLPFEEWSLPRGMGMGLVVLLLIAIMGRGLGISNFEVVQFTIAALLSFMFTVLGLSVLWFFLKAGRVPAVIRWILAILVYLFVGFGLPFLGMFDHIFHMRWKYENKFLFKNGR
ncbi:MAG TPA: DUF2232 domain-containing protein [Clostridiales bacterium]|nr:DUF2232 domain-containing protein [Clostridiales bacterium]